MLTLTRKAGESHLAEVVILLPDGRQMSVWLRDIKPGGRSARLGFEGPKDIVVVRREALENGRRGW